MIKIFRNNATITVLSLILLTILSLHLAPVSFDAMLIKSHKDYIREKHSDRLIDLSGVNAPRYACHRWVVGFDSIEWKGRNVYFTISSRSPNDPSIIYDTYHFTGKRYWIGKYKWILEDS